MTDPRAQDPGPLPGSTPLQEPAGAPHLEERPLSEDELLDEEPLPPRRILGLPRWLFASCGCGCLLALVTMALLTALGYRKIRDATNPEEQWPRLQEVLDYEERPEYRLQIGVKMPFGVFEMWTLEDRDRNLQVTVMSFPGARAEDMDEAFDPDPEGAPMGIGEPVDAEPGELEIQGRAVRILRYRRVRGEVGPETLGPGVRLDLSDPGLDRHLLVEVRKRGGDIPPSDEEITDFLEPFDVWDER